MLHKDYDRKGSVEKKVAGRESQGAWFQGELIGGKPPVTLTLTLTPLSVERSISPFEWGRDNAFF
jgi:hypothetical protein